MTPEPTLIALTAMLGAMFGSFLNVCIIRLPSGRSVVSPRSSCPHCGHVVRPWDNIPVLSWLILRGRCRDCSARISVQYPLVELASAILAAGTLLHAGVGWQWPIQFLLLYLLLGIAATDVREYIIPDTFSLGGLLAGLGASFLPGGLEPSAALVGALVGGGALYGVALAGRFVFKKEAMGGGDVKMLAMIGAFCGWQGVLFTVFAGSLAGSIIFGFINFVLKKERLVPFGLFLAAGAALYVFAGGELIGWYLSLFTI
jgi:leader peptidase (prepilin peptidase) / N-methyltransferase